MMNESIGDSTYGDSEISLSRYARFWLLLFSDLFSIICTLILIDYLIRDRKLRQALSNHVILVLLSLGLTAQIIEIPMYLSFIGYSGFVKPSKPFICLVWWFISLGMYNAGTFFMAWASFERHILVFKSQWVSTRREIKWRHYLPMGLIVVYIFIFYIYVIFFPPCENIYRYDLPICGSSPCFQENQYLGLWDFVSNNLVPSVLVVGMSMAFLIRVKRHKNRLNQHHQWRRQRKMLIQLLSLSTLNVVFNIPLNVLSLARFVGLPEDAGVQAQHYFYFSCYFLLFLFPFIALISYPELIQRLKQRFIRVQSRTNTIAMLHVWLPKKRKSMENI